METRNTLERRILLIGSHKRLLFDSLCAAAERYERHVQYQDVYYLYYTLNDEPIIVELTLAGIEHTGAREMAIRTADGVIISYAANYPASFNDLTSLLEDFRMRKNKNAPILLVRNEDEQVDLDPRESSSSCTGSSEDEDAGNQDVQSDADKIKSRISVEQSTQLLKEFGPKCEETTIKLSVIPSTRDLIINFLQKVLESDRRQRRRSTILDGLKQLNTMTLNKLKRHDKDGCSSHSSTSDISPAAEQENVEDQTKALEIKSEPATPAHSRGFMRTFKRNQTAPSSQKHNNNHNQEVQVESRQSKMPPLDDISVQTFNDIVSAGVSSKLIYEGSICDSYPCWNDGVCVESNLTKAGYLCMCNKFFSGDHCDIQVINNCSNVVCPSGTFCLLSTSLCTPVQIAKTFPRCVFEPCRNTGSCVMFDNDRPFCICPPNFHGLLCEYSVRSSPTVPMNLNVLQLLILFGVVFFLASAFLTLCYNGNYSCYLNWKRRYKYDKWSIESDFQWFESEEEEDENLINGGNVCRHHNNLSATDMSKNCFELKNKPLSISTTAESFVTYNGNNLNSTDSDHSVNPVDLN